MGLVALSHVGRGGSGRSRLWGQHVAFNESLVVHRGNGKITEGVDVGCGGDTRLLFGCCLEVELARETDGDDAAEPGRVIVGMGGAEAILIPVRKMALPPSSATNPVALKGNI